MKPKIPLDTLAKARDLRATPTDAENALWRRLRNRGLNGLRFRRQAPVGPFVADFLCFDPKLIVEVDGGQHGESGPDLRRDAYLQAQGYRVLRFSNTDVFDNIDGVLHAVAHARELPHPGPPPRGEGTPTAPLIRATALGEGSDAGDSVTLPYTDRYRRRARLTTDAGEAILLDLPEATELRDGAALVLEDGRHILIRAASEPLAEARGTDPVHLARLVWHVGNRHTPAQIDGDRLLIQRDHVLEDMLRGLGAEVAHVGAPFRPERGAYGHGRTHGHSHSHDPGADPSAHIPHRHD